ncbi:Protein IDA-LIKE 2 like [Melia azedarach]|uniref:Protein IDA-LIKE 2 like n=1 Tax=Melia azedarach TaxID=155640 RepID=A0ACC1XX11_MELAZ|nr:Protein IDA-LIKE 2 like [Melia azedarach]
MGLCRRRLVLLFWFLFSFIFLFSHHTHGSRTSNVFTFKPNSHQSRGHFLGFLPRHFPIPSSGPSRKHNDIGLQNWRSP